MLGARDEHPGGMITLEWLLLWQENKLDQPNLSWEGDGKQRGWGCSAGKQKEFL